ncbi:hypothetical protein [Streptomyces sp. NBC_00076]|uniref:hypothetical protein n=1 Tax=Streptomyces sp. NBC_00076 TaxID=2975642 RepID=UPI003245D63F
MTWRIESRTDPERWAEYTVDGLTSDRQTAIAVKLFASGEIPLTPTGPLYAPTGDGDEVALFLASVRAIPAPSVTGQPPPVPRVTDTPGDHIF